MLEIITGLALGGWMLICMAAFICLICMPFINDAPESQGI